MAKWKYVVIVFIFLLGIILLAGKFDLSKIKKTVIGGPKTVKLCYSKTDNSAEGGQTGGYSMRVEITGENVSGQLDFLPIEKDSKVGNFRGNVVDIFSGLNEREVLAWWKVQAEGMEYIEELRFVFNEKVASIGFGLMSERESGIFVYKNPESIAYTLTLQSTPCVLK